jgi:hypothetical protein
MTLLLHHFRNAQTARLLWLSWYSKQNEVWKDVCMLDGEFKSSGKHADAKIARKISCDKAVDALMAV